MNDFALFGFRAGMRNEFNELKSFSDLKIKNRTGETGQVKCILEPIIAWFV